MTRTDSTWLDDLTLELRLRNMDGRSIGDALATVKAHLAETGESAQDAFGDPRAYAESLPVPPQPTRPGWQRWSWAAATFVIGMSGALLAPRVSEALRLHRDVQVRWGDLVMLLAIGAFVAASMKLLPHLLRRLPLMVIWMMLGSAVLALPLLLLDGVALTLPTVPATVAVAVLLAASVLALALAGKDADPLVDPRTGEKDDVKGTSALTALVYVLVAVAMVLLDLLPGGTA